MEGRVHEVGLGEQLSQGQEVQNLVKMAMC